MIKDKYKMMFFMTVVIGHFLEHVIQAYQLFILKLPRAECLGLLGYYYPWLIHSEWLHYSLALFMLVGLWYLRPLIYTRKARYWWKVTIVLQFLHHIEHLVPLTQSITKHYIYGASKPMSLLQIWIPRIELHFIYNVIVMIPMVIAMVYFYKETRNEYGN